MNFFDPQIEKLTRTQLQALQMEKLSSLLESIYGKNQFYTAKYDDAGLHPGSIKALDDLSRLPLTTKAELIEAQQQDHPFGLNATFNQAAYTRFHVRGNRLHDECVIGRASLVHCPTKIMLADALTKLAATPMIEVLLEAMKGNLPSVGDSGDAGRNDHANSDNFQHNHCNGWCYTWTMSMLHGRVICLRNIDVKKIFELIDKYDVTHFGGAPIVLNMIANAPKEHQKKLKRKVHVLTAGAPPPSIIFEKMQNLGFDVMHVYGLTETYGHILQCAWNDEWENLEQEKQNEIRARQGVIYPNLEGAVVMDPETMKPVPKDGKTMGEIMIRGNVVMKGYYKDKEATEKSMKGGWFHSGDLAVTYPNGYIKIQDRSKDIIISGGENISSIEIENTIAKHPSVSLAAVVAKPDEKWGETPCAFVELIDGKKATEEEIIKFCRETLAGFKLPKKVVFSSLPKTSTGKIQKFELRKKVKELN